MVAIEEEVVEMPTTASPLFLIGLAGGAFLALGGLLGRVRRRLA
jgi:LPXTG-motif cell wall-anchored protein